jgi:hypothetical protein
MTVSAGQRLRAEVDKALAAVGRETSKTLEWSELELDVIDRAAKTADRAEGLRAVFDAEQAGEARPTVLVSLSGELRLLDKAVVDLLGRLEFGEGKTKSERHQRAANYRWNQGA